MGIHATTTLKEMPSGNKDFGKDEFISPIETN